MTKLNIILVGHGCLPGHGSELGVTWNWAWHLAARHHVWVITHGHFRGPIERYLQNNPRPNLRFIWVGPLGWWDPWSGDRSRGIRLHYMMWQPAAVAAAKRLIAKEPINIIHHVSWATSNAPSLLWRAGKPFVWGPIGGGQTLPWRFLPLLGRAAAPELLRTARVSVMPWMHTLRRTVAQTDLILAVNRETEALLRRAGGRRISLLADGGVLAATLAPPKIRRGDGAALTVLWASRMEAFKGLEICLDVANTIRRRDIRFVIAGWGSLRGWAERRVRNQGLEDRVSFLGRLSWQDMQQCLASADLFMFTSLRDTFGTVNLEAMAKGCPVICLDHNGVGAHLPDDAAIKVPVTTTDAVIRSMAREIEALASDRAGLQRMSEAAYRFANEQLWDRRALVMEQLYGQVLELRRTAHPDATIATSYTRALN
jgi:glycosyltransferase involved in cell wall biosynthesis